MWLLNGIPGSGKTTTAQALARRFPRAVHIEGDRLQEWIVTGGVPPGGFPPEEEARQIHLNVRNQCCLAVLYAGEGFTVVLDYVMVNRERVEEYRKRFSDLTVRLITLDPGIPTALARDARRPEKTVAAAWTHLEATMRRELNGLGCRLDNSTASVEETVDWILVHREAAKI